MDPSSVVKRAVLHNISSLCVFLGRQKTNDVLLSHMITYLNDRDWLLRYAFFDSIVDVAACAGGRSLEEYILPLMIQALSGERGVFDFVFLRHSEVVCKDVEETVVAKVIMALTSLCELGLFQKMRIWELMSATLGFLYHPNIWIRQGYFSNIITHRGGTDEGYRRGCVHRRSCEMSPTQRCLVYHLSFAATLLEVGRGDGR
jgi:phosphoinositide-3-kinase, regulatory subunit 4